MSTNGHQRSSTQHMRERLYSRLSAERTRADLERLERLTEREPLGLIRTAIGGYFNHSDSLWAAALTYTLSLSLVPFLVVALSAVKGLIGLDVIKSVIDRYLAFNSPELTNSLLQYVGNINAATLGTVGGATLLVTVLLTLRSIEQALNTIFNVAQERTWLRKFTDYLSITFTLPLLVAVAVPLKTNLAARLPHLPGLGWVAATLPIWLGFTFLYLFFPNRRIRWHCAALGGLVAAILLEIGQWAYLTFQVSAGRYQAIYGALAAVPILLGWIYIAWTIVLAGAELAAAVQGTEAGFSLNYRSPAFVRMAALLTVFRAAERSLSRNRRPTSLESLAGELGSPPAALRPVIDQFDAAGIIVEVGVDSGGPRSGIFLVSDPSELTLAEVFAAVDRLPTDIHGDERISSVLESIAASEQDALRAITVKDLVNGEFEHRYHYSGSYTNTHSSSEV